MIQRSEYCNGYLQLGLQTAGAVVGWHPCAGTVSRESDQTARASERRWGVRVPGARSKEIRSQALAEALG